MAENNNTFDNTVEALFKGMDNFITTKTVVGDAITIDGPRPPPVVLSPSPLTFAPTLSYGVHQTASTPLLARSR